ncbi:DUF3592 domain-containing protein [Tundrisphaera sp. TA3]|uniref:DUF3592 domain-containing protein n=1 Tax=Tundrisphaera sp. TA3 TaxID=3435775 RepID=UPI003EBEBF56
MRRPFRRTTGWSLTDRPAQGGSILTVVGGIFAVVGLGLLAGGFWSYRSSQRFVAKAATAEGEVVRLIRQEQPDRVSYRPLVRFRTPAGRAVEFTPATSSDPPAYAAGDRVEILYDPARPESASIRSFFDLWGVAAILGPLGFVFSAIGLGLLAFRVRERASEIGRARDREELDGLAQFGTRVEAKVREVRSEPDDTYRIIAQWHDAGQDRVHVFESRPLGYDPAEFVGETIGAFIDPNDPSRYLVDLSTLPASG